MAADSPPDALAPPQRVYTVWRAFGETIIVEGKESVWEEPGRRAEWLGILSAPDYETACQKWDQSQTQCEEHHHGV